MSIHQGVLFCLLDQRDAALAAGGLADPTKVVPRRRFAVREDVAAGHLLQLRRAQVLLRRPRGSIAFEDIVARQVRQLLLRDLLRRFHHAVGVSLSERDGAHLLSQIKTISKLERPLQCRLKH
ncbi:Os07g0623501 [Oryza sativa Japonica Group]|jgi:hypothetical protein|uniref:Os07g0623501 protein n=1 Tax=Oryza sativa subsp. japonica TaxID=39947 RepID=A0A0P0X907_ORYSJ|nr:hypothetical protein EE612_040769 [Oryza sativa]BAT02715.1 Os07g0623501 [Oryza sativa Japonica Group]